MSETTDREVLPSTVLRSEHRTIERVLRVLESLVDRAEGGQSADPEALKRCVEFFRFFADACHHAKEEDLLFPALEAKGIPRDGGPIGVMLYEHRVARALVKDMGEALDELDGGDPLAEERFRKSAREYIELLTSHIHKEDNCLFVMGDQVLDEADQRKLCRKFCEVGCRAFGGKRREDLERLADELEARL